METAVVGRPIVSQRTMRYHDQSVPYWLSILDCGAIFMLGLRSSCVAMFIVFSFASSIASPSLADEPTKPTPPLAADRLFEPQHLMVVDIEVAPDDWLAICTQTRVFSEALAKENAVSPFSYFKANIVIDGVRIPDVGIRKKGFLGSLDDSRPSLKVDFNQFGDQSPVVGIDRLTLNNNKQDRSLASQFLTYKLFADSGQPAPRCGYARVTVNGEYLGIYSHVESPGPPMMERLFGDGSGDLYEGTIADFFPNRIDKFEMKGKTANRELILAAADAVAAKEVDLERLSKLVDIDAFLKFWATESLIGFWDGYTQNQNNYFVYRNPTNNLLYFLPWGADSAFTDTTPLPPYFIKVKSVHSQSVLANRLFQLPEIQSRYRATLEKLLAEQWVEDSLNTTLDQLEAKLKDHLHESQKDFSAELAKIRAFIKNRRAVLRGELDKWPIVLTEGPRTPSYFQEFGSARGTFDTTWTDTSPAEPSTNGTAFLELIIGTEPVVFKQLGVSAEPTKFPAPVDKNGRKPPTLIFSGLRESDDKLFIVAVGLAGVDFRPTNGGSVVVQGILIEGAVGIFNPAGFKFLSGTTKFDAAEMAPGANVRGSLELQIFKMMGGEAQKAPASTP